MAVRGAASDSKDQRQCAKEQERLMNADLVLVSSHGQVSARQLTELPGSTTSGNSLDALADGYHSGAA